MHNEKSFPDPSAEQNAQDVEVVAPAAPDVPLGDGSGDGSSSNDGGSSRDGRSSGGSRRRSGQAPAKKIREAGATPGLKVRIRNAAVHVLYRRLVGVAFISMVSAVVSVVSLLAVIGKPVPPQYIPVTPDGRLLPLTPIDKPNMNHGGVARFAMDAIRAVNTYDYINYVDQLNAAQEYFSPEGWNEFEQEYKKSATLNAVLGRHMIVSVKPTAEVNFINEGIQPDTHAYVWEVRVPVEIVFTAHGKLPDGSNDAGSRENGEVTLYISRVPTTKSASGLAVELYIMTLTTAKTGLSTAPGDSSAVMP